MSHWEISEGYGLPKALKNLKENAPVLRSYARLIEQIKSCDNPAAFGEKKSGKYRHSTEHTSQDPLVSFTG